MRQILTSAATAMEAVNTSASTRKDPTSVSVMKDIHCDLTAAPVNQVRLLFSYSLTFFSSCSRLSREDENCGNLRR